MSMLTLIYCSSYTANHAVKYQLDARAVTRTSSRMSQGSTTAVDPVFLPTALKFQDKTAFKSYRINKTTLAVIYSSS